MNKSLWRLAPVGALMLALASCSSDDTSVWIYESDSGKTFTAAAGDTLKVKLWGNPTTGYSWNAAALSTNAPLVETVVDYTADSDLPGAGGNYVFTYEARSAGQAVVRIIYNRVFEPGVPPANTFQVTIAVQ